MAQKPQFDPGLTTRYTGPLRRIINQDGTFNVTRHGTDWRDVHPYLHLVSISWMQFFLTVLVSYVVVNVLFAAGYYSLGDGALAGGASNRFLQCVFFSSQTLTTVGFGAISPASTAANFLAAFEALCGLLGFAVATGLMYGRVSRPSARIGFSPRAIIMPYQESTALAFRMVNRRANTLVEPEVTVMLMTVQREGGSDRREYKQLRLERDKVMLFPLTWTVVHPIESDSPLFGKSADDLRQLQAELMVMVKAWDETFSQTVHQRYSYRFEEIVEGGRFAPAFGTDEDGNMHVHIDRVGLLE